MVCAAIVNRAGVEVRPCSVDSADFVAHAIVAVSRSFGYKLTNVVGSKFNSGDIVGVAHASGDGGGVHLCVCVCWVRAEVPSIHGINHRLINAASFFSIYFEIKKTPSVTRGLVEAVA